MSGYSAAILGVADLMTGASADAAYEAAYGQYYKAAAGMKDAANRRSIAEANIAAVKQDRINTNLAVSINQDHAEAQAKVAAAVGGTEGQSVQSAIYQTEVNSSVAQANNRKTMEQQVDAQLADVYASTSAMLAVDNPQIEKISMGMALAEAGTTLVTEMGPQLMDGIDSLFSSEADSSVGLGETLTFDAKPFEQPPMLNYNEMMA